MMKRTTYARHIRRLRSSSPSSATNKLLDCGAATGYFVELAKENGWDAFAVELSDYGSRACASLLGQDRVFRGELQDAFFAANPECQFDAITMFDFIEHVREPQKVLGWANQHLKPGGMLLLTTPRVGSISWRVLGRRWFHYVGEHLWFFSDDALKRLLSDAGFEIDGVHAAPKAITFGYALAHYDRATTRGSIFAPVAHMLNVVVPDVLKKLSLWWCLGEMLVLARRPM